VTLARRLLLGSFVVVSLLVLAIGVVAGGRLRARLVEEKVDELARDARVVAAQWTLASDADALAQRLGAAFGYRVTLIDESGVVLGDSDFDPPARRRLPNHHDRPEVAQARATGAGTARRRSASAGDDELYVALRHPRGYVRVSMSTARLDDIVAGAERDVYTSGLVALAGALILSALFARSITGPVSELRDVARAIAAGEVRPLPARAAPGEVGELAEALRRMSAQLSARLSALAADEQLVTAILESLEEGVLALDGSGQVVRINAAARALLGVSAATPFSAQLVPQEPELRVAVDRALHGQLSDAVEVPLATRTIAVASRPLATGGGVLTLVDLTHTRRLEAVRRDFVANVSHELKTPLTAVSGFAETLMDDDVAPADRRRFIETIRANASRMQRIVDDLLDLSRIEGGRWRPRAAIVDLAGMVGEVMSGFAAEAARKGIALETRLSPDATRVSADPTAVRQVLANLVENAVRYTPAGTVTLTVLRDGEWVRVRVGDTGVGIAAEHLTRVFERFYRVDAARSRDAGGTGLGLAIVKHLVEAHGGEVRAVSQPGEGTTMEVTFRAPERAG